MTHLLNREKPVVRWRGGRGGGGGERGRRERGRGRKYRNFIRKEKVRRKSINT